MLELHHLAVPSVMTSIPLYGGGGGRRGCVRGCSVRGTQPLLAWKMEGNAWQGPENSGFWELRTALSSQKETCLTTAWNLVSLEKDPEPPKNSAQPTPCM